ncbi:3'(2'), 5'-bisphosphate nucleotidase [Nematocida major]|uniref:3'(2'), 5'-bisphosphate nucleotidase n=1 Tax=Nematocida major TaxID=1912982 RepID=UPI0020077D33|nr:3'(2'), 5'-bisphosphate nucleotidase [Nematocida major]KAH9386815.1 3'(2'), 5'-bisphosphate nucleotidase [Nematocida major]
MENIEGLFRTVMKAVCYSAHLTKNAPLVSSVLKADMSVVSLYDVAIQILFCHMLREWPVTILSEEEDNAFYRETLQTLESCSGDTPEYVYIQNFLRESGISLEGSRIKAVVHSGIDPQDVCVVLDPIDGTKGFVSARSYSVVASCVHRGAVLFSIIACPKEGQIYYKCSMGGAGLSGYPHRKRVKTCRLGSTFEQTYSEFENTLSLHVCVSAEGSHSSSIVEEYLKRMQEMYPITVHRIDGQGKYAYVATQQMDIFLRAPSTRICEKLWDHCAGVDMNDLSVVTDLHGKSLDPCVPTEYGVLASHSSFFHRISIGLLKDLI